MNIDNLNKEESAFWSFGNNPTQSIRSLSYDYVLYHLKLLYLLSDKVVAAASFYYESEITRRVTGTLEKLFRDGEIVFFIDDDLASFRDHGDEKLVKSPKQFAAYSDKNIVWGYSDTLDSMCEPIKRPPISISDKIVELWVEDLYSHDKGSVGECIDRYCNGDKGEEIKQKLFGFAIDRNKDFVWEYLYPEMSAMKLDKKLIYCARRRLSQLYALSTAKILGIVVDDEDDKRETDLVISKKYNTSLFDECLIILGIRDEVKGLKADELIRLKVSPEFIYFREFYFSLISLLSYDIAKEKKILPLFVDAEKMITNKETPIDVFIEAFKVSCNDLGGEGVKYQNALSIILNKYAAFKVPTIAALIESVKACNKSSIEAEEDEIVYASPVVKYLSKKEDNIRNIIIRCWKKSDTGDPTDMFSQKKMHIYDWFSNFDESEYDFAFSIMRNIKYYDQDDINKMILKVCSELRREFENDFNGINFCPLGKSSSDSGSIFLYKIRQGLGLKKSAFPKDCNSIRDVKALVFFDDIIGSGNQSITFYNENLSQKDVGMYYFSLMALSDGLNNVKSIAGFKNVYAAEIVDQYSSVFKEKSKVYRDEKDRLLIESFAKKYGEKLYPKYPLGYDNCQALIVFEHNVPNNTLPIIWASENNEKAKSLSWKPLWERKKK